MYKGKNNLPPQKIAVLIDGGFFIKRFNALYNKNGDMSAEDVANAMYTMAHSHVGKNNVLYRIFYYDCKPLEKKFHNPITHKIVDFSKTKESLFRKITVNFGDSAKHSCSAEWWGIRASLGGVGAAAQRIGIKSQHHTPPPPLYQTD